MQAQLLSYKCPQCGQPIDVDATAVGQTITCPNPSCQQSFKIEAVPPQPPPHLVISPGLAHEVVQEQPASAVQAAPEIETELVSVHPLMFRRYPFRSLVFALASLVGLGLLLAGLVKGTLWVGLLGLVLVGYGMYRLGYWWLRMLGTSVTVTTKRTLVRTGVFHSQITEVPHAEVADIEIQQTLLNRLLGVGDLAIVHQAPDTKGILLMGLPHPEQIAQQIRTRRQV